MFGSGILTEKDFILCFTDFGRRSFIQLVGVLIGLSIPCGILEADELISNNATCNLWAPLMSKGYLELNPSGFRDKSYRICIYLVIAG